MRRLRAVATALAAAVVGLGGPAAAASAADDDQRPSVSLDAYVHPRVGSQIQTVYDGHGGFEYWQADYFLQWRASDAGSGICEQLVSWHGYEQAGGDEDPVLGPNTVAERVDKTARRYVVRNLNLFNHERIADKFVVRARDCAGNVGTSGVAEVVFGTRGDRSSKVTYAGRWDAKRAGHFVGRTARRTSGDGASFTTVFQGGSGPIALVMDKSPSGGRADVYVDGVRQATVDTVGQRRHRVVVWQQLYAGGRHTLRVVNRPEPGHRRITFDTLILGDGPGA